MKKQSPILLVIIVILVGVVAWYGFDRAGSDPVEIEGIFKLGDQALGTEQNKTETSKGTFWSNVFGGNGETYHDLTGGLSFKYPKGYSIREIPAPVEGEARTLLLSKEGAAPSVQVAVSSFDEDIVLTIGRIEADVPDLGMKNPQEIDVAGTKGVKFDSDSGVNVWFVTKGNLFQLTALSAEASVLDGIVSSFKIM